jgi:hypothetical protein
MEPAAHHTSARRAALSLTFATPWNRSRNNPPHHHVERQAKRAHDDDRHPNNLVIGLLARHVLHKTDAGGAGDHFGRIKIRAGQLRIKPTNAAGLALTPKTHKRAMLSLITHWLFEVANKGRQFGIPSRSF